MSSRADSTSPPPYSFETSSFPPPPPREGDVSRSWELQAKFEAAEEPVRQAVLDTITAWKRRSHTDTWDYIPRGSLQDAYDSTPEDLRKALEFIIDCKYTTYLDDDADRRRHEYFYHSVHGDVRGSTDQPLQSPAAFVEDFELAPEAIQNAILTTFALWRSARGGDYMKPARDEVLRAYERASRELRVLLNWVLDIGSITPVRHLRDVSIHEQLSHKYLLKSIAIKHSVQPIL